MPILAGAGGGAVSGFPWPRPLVIQYRDPDGVLWDWSDLDGEVIATNVAGYGGPPVALTGLAMPSGGMLPQTYQGTSRTIIVVLLLDNDDQSAYLDLQDRLTNALWTERRGDPAPGTLIIRRPNGRARQIQVLCTDGPDMSDEDRDKAGLTWSTYPATFKSLDSHWSDATPATLTFQAASGSGGVPPMPPVTLDPGAVLGQVTVTNTGDADAYPVWTITGPGTPTLTNVTTGRAFGLDVALSSGEVITVNTAPDGGAYAIDQDGDDRWGDLVKSSPRDLWTLVKGDNVLNLVLSGSDSNSKISMSYVRRWRRA